MLRGGVKTSISFAGLSETTVAECTTLGGDHERRAGLAELGLVADGVQERPLLHDPDLLVRMGVRRDCRVGGKFQE